MSTLQQYFDYSTMSFAAYGKGLARVGRNN